MTSPTTNLPRDAVAPLTHIFLSLDLLETSEMNEEIRPYLNIIRENTERLQSLLQSPLSEKISA
jgi:nitrogen-specific signal transduction histidine kinase